MTLHDTARALRIGVRTTRRKAISRVRTEVELRRSRDATADLALFHEFAPPPGGGGHQFLRALLGELERRGLEVEIDWISSGTRSCLYNSFNLDAVRLRRFLRPDVRCVHRIDGPIGAYRGFDDGTDRLVMKLNVLADATILQSAYSLDRHRELGLEPRSPVVIHNAPDPAIFHPPTSRVPVDGRRIRVVATSWSANPRKGARTLEWLDRHLDSARYELTFVGNTSARLERATLVPPLPSRPLAALLRDQDLYLAASRDDPCSNALLEALACGLPPVYLRSGGHPELVGEGGLPFDADEELPAVLEALVGELDDRRAAISVPALADVADRYLEVLRP